MEKWVRVSTGSFLGQPDRRFELPTGLGQVYRKNQYVSDVTYRFVISEVAGELTSIWGYVEIVDGIQDQFEYGDEYTLRLDNGRLVEIVIKTLDFNSGEYLFADRSVEEQVTNAAETRRHFDRMGGTTHSEPL